MAPEQRFAVNRWVAPETLGGYRWVFLAMGVSAFGVEESRGAGWSAMPGVWVRWLRQAVACAVLASQRGACCKRRSVVPRHNESPGPLWASFAAESADSGGFRNVRQQGLRVVAGQSRAGGPEVAVGQRREALPFRIPRLRPGPQ